MNSSVGMKSTDFQYNLFRARVQIYGQTKTPAEKTAKLANLNNKIREIHQPYEAKHYRIQKLFSKKHWKSFSSDFVANLGGDPKSRSICKLISWLHNLHITTNDSQNRTYFCSQSKFLDLIVNDTFRSNRQWRIKYWRYFGVIDD